MTFFLSSFGSWSPLSRSRARSLMALPPSVKPILEHAHILPLIRNHMIRSTHSHAPATAKPSVTSYTAPRSYWVFMAPGVKLTSG